MLIRPAIPADAEQAAAVLRRSIRDLCIADHHGDAEILREWLSNKTPDNVRLWIKAPDRLIVVAEDNGAILGVGGASGAGEITPELCDAGSPLQRHQQGDPPVA
ncbi:hypothetical protein SAMN05192571_11155 [Pleomorphomonas diazotrophica]|uniref:GNAT family N-acetyltransferase n=1 Tax=Pleomorphomonas diazotrophica TaxID=1166257 RepID=UPI0008DF14AA|nr:hypothetical protein [Pleomorphomonas diazotrophica]SFM99528.1 hypothetical protein SAMN05192571_11155 [Pleomorphomonas diazotrophica]